MDVRAGADRDSASTIQELKFPLQDVPRLVLAAVEVGGGTPHGTINESKRAKAPFVVGPVALKVTRSVPANHTVLPSPAGTCVAPSLWISTVLLLPFGGFGCFVQP